jgi:hypothetical protein
MAVCYDGTTIYAGAGALNDNVYKSTNAGLSWNPLVNNTGMDTGYAVIDTDLIAVASDSMDFILVADAATNELRLSQDGGSTWSDFGTVAQDGYMVGNIVSIAISAAVNGVRYAAIADDAGGVYTRKFGTAWNEWVEASADYAGWVGDTGTFAVAFSPNFQGDRTLAVVDTDGTDTFLELLVFSATPVWNDIINYPAAIVDAQTLQLMTPRVLPSPSPRIIPEAAKLKASPLSASLLLLSVAPVSTEWMTTLLPI